MYINFTNRDIKPRIVRTDFSPQPALFVSLKMAKKRRLLSVKTVGSINMLSFIQINGLKVNKQQIFRTKKGLFYRRSFF